MRIIPIFTALAAMAILYLVVFERDRVLEFAGLTPETEAVEAAETVAETTVAEENAEAAGAAKGVSVIAIESVAQEIDSAVILRGRTEAARAVQLVAETSGRVISPPTPKGTLVAAGDVLCEIDMGTREASLAEARARLSEAEANARLQARSALAASW